LFCFQSIFIFLDPSFKASRRNFRHSETPL
jgi:hypothetical protein